jgi:hypothetical protein
VRRNIRLGHGAVPKPGFGTLNPVTRLGKLRTSIFGLRKGQVTVGPCRAPRCEVFEAGV